MTNNSTKSRAGYLKKFTGLGLNVKAEEIYSSSYAAAAYLESIEFPANKKVYVVGEVRTQAGDSSGPACLPPCPGTCDYRLVKFVVMPRARWSAARSKMTSPPGMLAAQPARNCAPWMATLAAFPC